MSYEQRKMDKEEIKMDENDNKGYYDGLLENTTLDEVISASEQYNHKDDELERKAIVPAEQNALETKVENPPKKINFFVGDTYEEVNSQFKKALVVTTKYIGKSVENLAQWAFKWATYPTIGMVNHDTKKEFEKLVGKDYFNAEEAVGVNILSNFVTYPLITYMVSETYNWNIDPTFYSLVPAVIGISWSAIECGIRGEDFEHGFFKDAFKGGKLDEDDKSCKNYCYKKYPTLIGAVVSRPIKSAIYLAQGIKEGVKTLFNRYETGEKDET